jgi:integrase/recombinase XerD
MKLDIHDYETRFAYAERQVRQCDLSQRNKDLILGYRDACILKGTCSRVRLIRVLGVLVLFGRSAKKDFDQLKKEDVEQLVTTLVMRKPAYSPETLGTYKSILKNFLIWVVNPDQFPTKNPPALVAWITTHVRARDKKRLDRAELLTPEDIQALLAICHNTRDKALISMLWETGCRIAELGNLQLKHVTKNQHGYTIDVNGKTGQRSPLVISSAPYLTQWLNNHPFKDNPESPLWVHYQYKTTPEHLRYCTIRYLLARYFQRANIKKPYHPHIFRHSRATYVLANGIMNEQQAKAYFGWTPGSDMLATYSHLITGDANAAILKENNMSVVQQKAKDLLPQHCVICQELNQPNAEYCTKCGAVLDLKRAYEHQQLHDVKDDIVFGIVKLLVQRGLVDDAAKELHDANLGTTLKRLVEYQQGKPARPLGPEPTPPPAAQPAVTSTA